MKKFLYVYSNCSPHKYKDLVESSGIMILQQAQKYHQLMLEGISENGYEVTAVSCLPVNRKLKKEVFFKAENDVYKNIKYKYLSFINLSILRSLSVFINSFFFCLKCKNMHVICDVLNTSISTGALFASKLTKKKVIGIVTDIPGDFFGRSSIKVILAQKVSKWILNKFDGYLFLTEQMNVLINKSQKPYAVVEGQVDVGMGLNTNAMDQKYDKKVCIYAGSLNKIYGIGMLVNAFIKANIDNAELHIYGDGDYTNDLNEIIKGNNKVKYFGVKPNDYIVKEQQRASLLINPRPTNEEYTKYSFPSKNMEYMASGTPTLTTKLPGMPAGYTKYVYLIEDESIDGLASTLRLILSKSPDELHLKGISAKDFVLREKNNVMQSRELLNLLERLN